MTVNRTTLLDLPLPVTGTESGTWGDTTNNGLTQYVDIAVAGMNSLTSANFTAGALTLANTTGDSSATNIAAGSAQYGAIKVSSLATNSTITAPSSNRRYTIINADATYSVTIKASGQTGVVIAAGEKALVAFNGTDYVKIATANGTGEFTTVDTTNLEVTNIKAKDGTAAATIADSTGVVTVTAAPVMTALTASQAVFTTAGKALTSNAITGTGNVVMSASPTLTGTISAAAATLSGNLTLSGGTANGVLYLDGSKVATTGSALTFDGTNFGIGTSSPSFNLDIGNTSATSNFTQRIVSGASYAAMARYDLSGTGTFTVGFNNSGSVVNNAPSGAASLWMQQNYPLVFGINGSEQMRLTSTGLGIGTSSPSYKLDVRVAPASGGAAGAGVTTGSYEGTILITGSAYNNYGVGANTAWLYSATNDVAIGPYGGSGTVQIVTGGARRATFDSSGNLGLGVTPSAWQSAYKALEVGNSLAMIGGSNAADLYFNAFINSGGSFRYRANDPASAYSLAAGQHRWYTAPSGTAGNAITFTQAMTLDASGDGVIGDTNTNGIRWSIVKTNPTRGILAHIYNLGSSSWTGAQIQFTQAGLANWVIGQPAGEDAFAFWSGRNTASDGTERARITSGGNLLVGRTSAIGGARVSAETTTGTPTYAAYLPTTGAETAFLFVNPNGSVGSITTNGSATAYNTSSDYRLKDNPQPLTGSGAFIDALKPKTWNWKADGSRGVGFIAHEVQEVSPGSVVGEKDGEQMQAMEYGSAEFIANIIAELQSLRQRVALLEGN